jgi:putative ABC transport system substrate-binding protein
MNLRRRDFITLLAGAAAAWPLEAPGQQQAIPVIGFLHTTSLAGATHNVTAFRQGLMETGFIEGQNVAVEFRSAEDQPDRLPALVADLVRRRVAVIVATGVVAASAAQAATKTIPIVFRINIDPVQLGFVTSLAHPGGNLTGVNFLAVELISKRMQYLRELVPGAIRVAVLIDPALSRGNGQLGDVEAAAHALGLQTRVLNASTSIEIDGAFASLAHDKPDALFVGVSAFFSNRRVQLANLASHHSIPMTSATRETVEAGGLMSYGPNVLEGYRQAGIQTGRILKGIKAADLPVVQATKFELVINHQTARMLGITVPPTLLAVADEVIE